MLYCVPKIAHNEMLTAELEEVLEILMALHFDHRTLLQVQNLHWVVYYFLVFEVAGQYSAHEHVDADDGGHGLLFSLEVVREAQAVKLELEVTVVENREAAKNEEDKVEYEMKSRVDRKEVPAQRLDRCHRIRRDRHLSHA